MPPVSPTLHFGVVGNPIAHSRSPDIHLQFARQAGLDIRYERILAPLDHFPETCMQFFSRGHGLNVTVPFKEQAYALAKSHLSDRARHAAAVNTLWQDKNGRIHGCNTDGIGLCTDLARLGHYPEGKRILLIGAGGAARGVISPLLEQGCSQLRIINRTAAKALALCQDLSPHIQAPERLSAGGLQEHRGTWDIVINASSSSMNDQAPDLSYALFSEQSLAYDLFYAPGATSFMLSCKAGGVTQISDGLGMLVAQAAASFEIWTGFSPDVAPVLRHLRRQLGQTTQ